MIINIIGLAIGIASSVLISLYVYHEMSYDSFNEKKEQLYRVNIMENMGGQAGNTWATASIVGPTVAEEFPEVEAFMRIAPTGGSIIKINNQSFFEEHRIEADSTFFDFFTVPLLQGDPKNVLNTPYTAVLSQTAANKYYGTENPVGQTFTIGDGTTVFTVTGLMEDIPDNCHLEADMITSLMTNPGSRNTGWLSNNNKATYVLLAPNTSAQTVDDKFTGLVEKYIGPEVEQFIGIKLQELFDQGNAYGYYLQPVTQIHIEPEVENLFSPAKDPKSLYIFACIALLIIIIAGINYMNLSTAQATKRAKEVGIKRVVGSNRSELVKQFLSESAILSLASLVIAIVIIELILPYFNNILQLDLDLEYFNNLFTVPGLLILALAIGLLSGLYPAFFLSRIRPIVVLKGAVQSGLKNVRIRKILVVFQFTVSIMLIVGTIIMYKQVNYMQHKDLGFNKENLLVASSAGSLGTQNASFKEVAEAIPGVRSVSFSTTVPGRNNNNNGYMMEGRDDEVFLMYTCSADYDFLKTFEMEMLEGRFFDEERGTDQQACIVNEAAVKAFNFDDPLNQRITIPGESQEDNVYAPIIGVIKDFHHESLHRQVEPYIIRYRSDNSRFGFASFRIEADNTQATIDELEQTWNKFTSNDPFQYFFADEEFDRLYRGEKQNAQLAVIFSILAILIGTLGLFGMTSYSLAQRTREIGVRRTMGATVSDIYVMISKEITILIGISTIISWTAIFFLTKSWLQNFHYQVGINPLDFVLGFLIVMIISILTITFRTLKAARMNPAISLKYE